MADEKNESGARLVAGNAMVTMNLTAQRQLSITLHMFMDESMLDRQRRLDEVQAIVDRQFVLCDIVTKKAQLLQHKQNLRSLRNIYEELGAAKDAGKKLTSQEKQNLENAERSSKMAEKAIVDLEKDIAEAENKVKLE